MTLMKMLDGMKMAGDALDLLRQIAADIRAIRVHLDKAADVPELGTYDPGLMPYHAMVKAMTGRTEEVRSDG